MFIQGGTFYCFSIFFKPLIAEFNWSRATTSLAFSLSLFVMGLSSFFMGKLNDRYGSCIIVTVGGVFLGGGLLLM